MDLGPEGGIKTGSTGVVLGIAPKITMGVVYVARPKVKDKG